MTLRTRREVFADVGRGMIASAIGVGLASDLGFALPADGPDRLTFGNLEPLVAFLQETPPTKLLPQVVEKLRTGTSLEQLVSAAALANARAFGGEDYVGFHTLMALVPAFHMSVEEDRNRPLAVLKVLVRNSARLQEFGGAKKDILQPVKPGETGTGTQLRDDVRKADMDVAEATFAAAVRGKPQDALDALMVMVDDATEVHRVVLVSRAWDLIPFVGAERAHTLLRQSVRYCVKSERYPNHAQRYQDIRDLLPKLLDQHHLLASKPGTTAGDDAWVAKFADTVFGSTPAQAADAVAAALAEGISADAVAEAMALAANQLVLRDEGRPANQAQPNKPVGSIHGDSIGVHACDSANAWRNLARAGDRRTQVTSLILGGYQLARDRAERGGEFLKWEPYPRAEHLEKVKGVAGDALMNELRAAIRDKDQIRAAAITHRIGMERPTSSKDVFRLFREFATSEDGALHAEKYYRTTSEEFARSRPAFQWRQLVALARVTASAFGQPAPGYTEACELLKG